MTFYGKYRGKVTGNADPMQLGRVEVDCPAVLGAGRRWAMPSVPFAGPGVGLFLTPPVGTGVWVEFEAGDADLPIWSGCFWEAGQVPVAPAVPETKVLKTDGVTLTISDVPGAGGVTLEVAPPLVPAPLTIKLSPAGIELTSGNASVALSAVSVSINKGALEVT
ncbi:hypothetical protein J5X84_24255 [Streptosporangiaceae bacterium NEAU-GS5]|nr:hypothetical protein [Streptosporangiaceae bacterium NEAU-GS5]